MKYSTGFNSSMSRAICLCALIFASASGWSESFSSSYAELGAASNTDHMYSNSDTKSSLNFMRLAHYGVWDYGDNFFFFDQYKSADPLYNSFNSNSDKALFAGWISRFSLNKLAGVDWSNNFVKGAYLAYRMERYPGTGFPTAIDNVGVSFDLAVPGTAFFEQDLYSRSSTAYSGSMYLARTVWLAPFTVGSVKLHFDGLLLVNTWNTLTDTKKKTLIQFQPELMADLTSNGKIQAGVRLIYDRGEQLIDADFSQYVTKSHTTPMLLARWNF